MSDYASPLPPFEIVRQALARYFDFYNRRRPHSTLDGQTPDTAYFNQPLLTAAA